MSTADFVTPATSSSSRATIIPEAQVLLTTLVALIERISNQCIAHSPTVHSEAETDSAHETEGHGLVAALERFVEAVATRQLPASTTNIPTDDIDVPLDETVVDVNHAMIQTMGRVIPSQELPVEITEAVYKRVFTEMPIRVLAFDAHGNHIQLLERSAIANQILSRISAAHSSMTIQTTLADGLALAQDLSRYAILSHTWIRATPGDVVFGRWAARTHPAYAKGYSKIAHFCAVAAREHGLAFGWMDTVCINKDSSSELDESIRSMYRWYNLAHVCITYLSQTQSIDQMHADSWFTRGWTLQELLAPRNIQFYNRDWDPLVPSSDPPQDLHPDFESNFSQELQDRLYPKLYWENDIDIAEYSLTGLDAHFDNQIPLEIQYQIFKATTITRSELMVFRTDPRIVPMSRKMQLASSRKVTREEDKIYSLMGLLGVMLPVAYGEGPQSAFNRLIREIMASKDYFLDIFNHGSGKRSLIPSSISDYLNRHSVFDRTHLGRETALHRTLPTEPILWTHLGARITLLLVPAFRKDVYTARIPKESVSQVVGGFSDFHGNFHDYLLLKDDDFSAQWMEGLSLDDKHNKLRLHPYIVFFGILNFSTSNGIISIPPKCLAIPIDPGLGAGSWEVGQVDPTNAELLSGPMVILWSNNHLQRSINHEQRKRRGIQIITLHLK